MPQPLNLAGGGSGNLLVRRQMRTVLHACPGVTRPTKSSQCGSEGH
jgi:hypothetical protein